MQRRYEETKPPRFQIEHVDGAEQIRIRARRQWFALPFLVFWLTLWTIGGGLAIAQVLRAIDPFLLVWLVGWALGWVFAAATILWQLGGSETLRVVHGDLEIGYSLPLFARHRLYRGSEIRGLAAAGMADLAARMQSIYPPFFSFGKAGSVKFNYGARTIQIAAGLDEAEARLIVEHLRTRLPIAATA